MHELTHGMVFNNDYYDYFRDGSTGEAVSRDAVLDHIDNNYWIISPEVQRVAREHFDCDDLPGALLDDSRYHWSGRMLNTLCSIFEILAQFLYNCFVSNVVVYLEK